MTYLSRALYEGDGTTTKYTVPFPYLAQSDVSLLVNNVSSPFIWLNASQIQTFGFEPPEGSSVLVIRNTTVDAALVTYTNASVLTEDQLNRATLQNLYLTQELFDLYNATLDGSLSKVAAGNGITIVDPTQLLQTITYDILDSELLADLNSRSTDINANAEGILALTSSVGTQQDFLNLLGSVSDGVLTVNTSTVLVSPGVSMAAQISGIEANVSSNTAGIATESTARADGDSALAAQISILVAGTAHFFVQPTAPTSPSVGDVWYDSSDNNHPYKWDGTSWVDVRDGAITDALADIATEATVRAAADTALATSISTLSTTVGANTASLTTQGTSINGLEAEFTVKTDINGFVAGYGLAEYLNTDGTHTSDFIVLADQFGVVFPTTPWTAGMTVSVGQFVIPSTTPTGFIYKVTTGGVTGSVEPVWPTTAGFTYSPDGAVHYLTVAPTAAAPFVVGNVGGVASVGINGGLVVDGTISATAIVANSITAGQIAASTITAAKLNVGTLSAISANMGTVTAGTFATATGSATRVEISGTGSFPLWYGSGTKTAGNATMYVDTSGDLFLTGTITGSLFDLYSLRMDTGGGRRCPLAVTDQATWTGGSTTATDFSMILGPFTNPNYSSGYDPMRIYSEIQDFFFDITVGNNGFGETYDLQYKYAGQSSWTTLDSIHSYAGYCLPWKPRYTTKNGSWDYVQFRLISTNGTCYNATISVQSFNFLKTSNAGNSTSDNTGDSGSSWGNPPVPPGSFVP